MPCLGQEQKSCLKNTMPMQTLRDLGVRLVISPQIHHGQHLTHAPAWRQHRSWPCISGGIRMRVSRLGYHDEGGYHDWDIMMRVSQWVLEVFLLTANDVQTGHFHTAHARCVPKPPRAGGPHSPYPPCPSSCLMLGLEHMERFSGPRVCLEMEPPQ